MKINGLTPQEAFDLTQTGSYASVLDMVFGIIKSYPDSDPVEAAKMHAALLLGMYQDPELLHAYWSSPRRKEVGDIFLTALDAPALANELSMDKMSRLDYDLVLERPDLFKMVQEGKNTMIAIRED